jgi:hypothetical protein
MRTRRRPASKLILVGCFVSLFGTMAATASAQPVSARTTDLERVLVPGRTVWLTDFTGHETKTRIVSVANGMVTTGEGGGTLRF